jgi:hypothetical protein
MYRALVLEMDQSGNDVPTNDSDVISARQAAKVGLTFGPDPLLAWAASQGKEGVAPPDSTALPYAGFYTMRGGWKPDDFFLFFRAGPLGSSHTHNDMLQIVLRAWNKTLLLEPSYYGNYPYDSSDWRRYSNGTASHNTIIVDGKWQNRKRNGASNQPSSLTMTNGETADSGVLPAYQLTGNPWVTTPLFDFVAGTYDDGYQANVFDPHPGGYEKWEGEVDHSVTHTRRILYLRPYYALVLDTLDGTGNHTFDAHFHLDAPAAHLDPSTQAAYSDNPEGAQLGLFPIDHDHLTVDIVQGQKDPLLGWIPMKHQPIPTIRFRKQQSAPAVFATFLYPYQGNAPAFKASALTVTGDGIWGQALRTDKEQSEVAIVKDGTARDFTCASLLLGPVKVTASGLVSRQAPGAAGMIIGGWNLSSYSDAKTTFTLDAPGTILLTQKGTHPQFFNGGDKPITLTLTQPFAQTITLPSGVWTEVAEDGSHPVTVGPLFVADH